MKILAIYLVAAFVFDAWAVPVTEEKVEVKATKRNDNNVSKKSRVPNLISQIRQILEEGDEDVEVAMAELTTREPTKDSDKAQKRPQKKPNQPKTPEAAEIEAYDELIDQVKSIKAGSENNRPLMEGEKGVEKMEIDEEGTTIDPSVDDDPKRRPTTKRRPGNRRTRSRKPIRPIRTKPNRRPLRPKPPTKEPDTESEIPIDEDQIVVRVIPDGSVPEEQLVDKEEALYEEMEVDEDGATINPTADDDAKRRPTKEKRKKRPKIPEEGDEVIDPVTLQEQVLESIENIDLNDIPGSIAKLDTINTGLSGILADLDDICRNGNPIVAAHQPKRSPFLEYIQTMTAAQEKHTNDVLDLLKNPQDEVRSRPSSVLSPDDVVVDEVKSELIKSDEAIKSDPIKTETPVKPLIPLPVVREKVGQERSADIALKSTDLPQDGLKIIALLRGINQEDLEKLRGLQNAIQMSLESTIPKMKYIQEFEPDKAKDADWNELTESIKFVQKQFSNKSVAQVVQELRLQELMKGYENFLKEEGDIRKSYLESQKEIKC